MIARAGAARRGRALAATVALLALAATARAQSTGVAVDRFVPGVGPAVLFGSEGALTTPRGEVALALSLGVVRDPARLVLPSGELLSRPVRWQLATDLSAEAGVWGRLALGVGVPVVWWQAGDRLRGTGDDRPLASPAGGDLSLRAKAALVDGPRVGLAALLVVSIPLGGQSDFAATDGVAVEPRLIADVRLGRAALTASLGVRFVPERTLFSTRFGDELSWSAGVIALVFGRGRWHGWLVSEAAGFVGGSDGTRPVEARGGARLGIGRVAVDLGAGAGLDSDLGAPAWRLFAVARASFGHPR